MDSQALDALINRYVLFSCEGTAEGVVVQVLYDNDLMVVPRSRVVMDSVITNRPYTRKRKAREIADEYFSMDYETDGAQGLTVARIVDSHAAKFEFPRRQQNGTKVLSFLTRPEIEMLLIHAESAYSDWLKASRRNRQLKPSDFCKQQLGFADVKKGEFLREYWGNPGDLVDAVRAYAENCKRKPGELALADLLR